MLDYAFNYLSMTTRFCIVRHGETAWNAEHRVQGQLNIPLNPTGQWQARALGVALAAVRFDALVCSDLSRAYETALISSSVMDGDIETEVALRERHYGKFQGLKYVEAQQQFPADFAAHLERHLDFAYASGESLQSFAVRVGKVMDALAKKHKGKTVLVVTHGGCLDVVYRMASGIDLTAPRNFPIPNAAINWVDYVDGRWSIVGWADCAHLEATLDEIAE